MTTRQYRRCWIGALGWILATAGHAMAQFTELDSTAFTTTVDQVEGDVLPGSLTSWTDQGADALTTVNGNGTITTNWDAAGDQRWIFGGSPLDNTVGWSWEARIRVDEANAADPARSVFAVVTRDEGGPSPWVDIHPDGLGTRGGEGSLVVREGWEKDLTDDFHTVRMAFDPTLGTAIWLDKVLLEQNFPEDGFVASNAIILGNTSSNVGDGTATIDYIRFDTTGAFAPVGALDRATRLEIDRTTGSVKLINNTGEDRTITGYRIVSDFGALDPTDGVWMSIADTADANSGNSFDSLSNWLELTPPTDRDDLSEVQQPGGIGVTMSQNDMVDLGHAWIQTPTKDVELEVLLLDGTVESGPVFFVGNCGISLKVADFDGSGMVDESDWAIFRSNHGADLAGFTGAEAYSAGDLNADLLNDIDDFIIFEAAFDADNGAGAFAAMAAQVPEPSSLLLAGIGLLFLRVSVFSRKSNMKIVLSLLCLASAVLSSSASFAQELTHNATNIAVIEGDTATPGGWNVEITGTTSNFTANTPSAGLLQLFVDEPGGGTRFLNNAAGLGSE